MDSLTRSLGVEGAGEVDQCLAEANVPHHPVLSLPIRIVEQDLQVLLGTSYIQSPMTDNTPYEAQNL